MLYLKFEVCWAIITCGHVQTFWEKQQELKFTRHPGKYFRYSPEALQSIILRELFHYDSSGKDTHAEPSVRSQLSRYGTNRLYNAETFANSLNL